MQEREREVINNLENLEFKITITKSLMRILGEHFDCKRYKDSLVCDYYSITYMFDEYRDLSYDLSERLVDIEKRIADIVKDVYEIRKQKDGECNETINNQ